MGRGDGKPTLLEFQNIYSGTWSDQYGHYPIGDIEGISIENVEILKGRDNLDLLIHGYIDSRESYSREPHYIKNVTINNFKLFDRYLEINDFDLYLTENVVVTHN